MKYLLAKILLMIIILNCPVFAQKYQKTILAFDIYKANNNGTDNSKLYQDKAAYVQFYQNGQDSVINLSVVWPVDSSASYGPITTHPMKTKTDLFKGYETEKAYYKWFFVNSYDTVSGWANVELSIVHGGEAPYYVLKIITHNDFEILIYEGYINEKLTGSLSEISD